MCDLDDDNWLNTAMEDDTIVANFLLSLTNPHPPSSSSRNPYPPLTIHWTVRQRRSNSRNSTAKSTRASPTTPLSWSANTSASGAAANTADGIEESSRHFNPVHSSRSKVVEQSQADANKRSRKKRPVSELLEEEKLLMKERGNLKDKLSSMHLTVEQERAKNVSLKKIKLDLVSHETTKIERTSLLFGKPFNVPVQLVCSSSTSVQHPTVQEKQSVVIAVNASSSSSLQQEINNRELPFVLPDLNLPPDEEFNASIIS